MAGMGLLSRRYVMPAERKPWTREELLVVFRLYCHTPFGRLHQRNIDIIELADLMGRTPSAVAMKACNFASLDPEQQARGVRALGNIGHADRELWETFLIDSPAIAQEAEAAYVAVSGREADDYLPELGHVDKIYRQRTRETGKVSGKLKEPEGPTEKDALLKIRRVQSFFRAAVLISYEYRCALTGLGIPELLTASHIIPWSVDEKRRADPRNGICLNALHDRAFDRGLISFDKDLRVIVSSRIGEQEDCSIHRYQLIEIAGHALHLPARFQPEALALDYHRKHVFKR
jgi:putative restriction endonuclease